MKSTARVLVVLCLLMALVSFGVAAHLPHAHEGDLAVRDCVFCRAHGVSVEPLTVAGVALGPVSIRDATPRAFENLLYQGMPLLSPERAPPPFCIARIVVPLFLF